MSGLLSYPHQKSYSFGSIFATVCVDKISFESGHESRLDTSFSGGEVYQ